MSEALAGVAAADAPRVLLESGPQSARRIEALRYALDAMRAERAPSAPAAHKPRFEAEMERQASVAPAGEVEPASTRTPLILPPAPPLPALAATPSTPAPATTPPSAAPTSASAPSGPAALDLAGWARGFDEGAPVTFEEEAPAAILAPDISALARSEQNLVPPDVLEIMRARHLGPQAGGGGNGR